MAQYRDINFVLGKDLGVLGHAELFEPNRNLRHRGPFPRADDRASFWADFAYLFSTLATKVARGPSAGAIGSRNASYLV
jgi:hypothetical protein